MQMQMQMQSYKQDAISALEYNNTTPEVTINILQNKPNIPMIMIDYYGDIWTFITRRQHRVYLLAKTKEMNKYLEICYKKLL